MAVNPASLQKDFERLADGALTGAVTGLMHRDFQSRNIMLRGKDPFIIDFQGARKGPIQYDLASLLIDPYVGLSESLQEELFEYALDRLLGMGVTPLLSGNVTGIAGLPATFRCSGPSGF